MSENSNTNQGGTSDSSTADPSSGGKVKKDNTTQDAIVVDKNKSPEEYIKEAEVKYIIPSLVRETFPDLIKLIYETESMNHEEREYWMQIMPIMTEEQISKFRGILVNEKEQLTRLDNEYENEMSKINSRPVKEIDEAEMKERIGEIKQAEAQSQEIEATKEEDLLSQIQQL